MATNTASTGNLSAAGTWSLGYMPIATEDVVIPTGVTVTWDAAAGNTWPVTGGLGSLTFQGTGQLAVPLNVFSAGASVAMNVIGALTIGANTTASINVTGSAAGKTLTVTYGSFAVGTGPGIKHGATSGANVIVNGPTTGGSATSAHGFYIAAASALFTQTGNATGSATNVAYGTYCDTTSAVGNITGVVKGGGIWNAPGVRTASAVTFNGSLDFTGAAVPWEGRAFTRGTSLDSYFDLFITATGTISFGPEPDATEMTEDVVCGGTTGTYRISTLAGNVRTGVNYGPTGALIAGTVNVPTAAQTLYGVAVDVAGTGTVSLPNTGGGSATGTASLVTTAGYFGPANATQGTLDMSLYALISGITWPALDDVDGGVQFGPVTGVEYEGIGMNSDTIATMLDARGVTTSNVAQTANNNVILSTLASDVWVQSVRTLTAPTNLEIPSASTIASDVWVETTRTLSAATNLNIPTSDAVADAVLKTDVSDVQAAASGHSLTTLVLAGTESSVSGLTWTIKKTDGTTFATKTLTSDTAAYPITGVT